MKAPYFIGIDGGGTSCRAVVADTNGKRLGHGSAGPANLLTDLAQASNNITTAAQQAIEDAGLTTELSAMDAVLGLAGASVAGCAESLLPLLPFHRNIIETDSAIALQGALHNDDGTVVLLGTGSVVVYRLDGEIQSLGGHGHVLSDQGSGAWLGKRLLHDTLLCAERVYPHSAITKATLQRFNNKPDNIVRFASTAAPAEFAELAGTVMHAAGDDGDAIAIRIVSDACALLTTMIRSLPDRCRQRICLHGGLAALYSHHLQRAFGNALEKPHGDALDGAIAIALQRLTDTPDK